MLATQSFTGGRGVDKQFGGTTVTALILGQAPSWLAGLSTLSPLYLLYLLCLQPRLNVSRHLVLHTTPYATLTPHLMLLSHHVLVKG